MPSEEETEEEVDDADAETEESRGGGPWESLHKFHRNSERAADANQTELDKSMLKYGSLLMGGLVLFAEKVGESHPLGHVWMGITAASSCALSVAFTILQYPLANMAIWKRQKAAYDYYILDDESARDRKSKWDKFQTFGACFSAVSLLLGLLFAVLFVSLNLNGGKVVDEHQKKLDHTQVATDALPARIMDRKPQPQTAPNRAPALKQPRANPEKKSGD